VARDGRDRGIRLLVGPDDVADGVAAGSGHTVVTGVAFERTVRAGVRARQQLLRNVAERNILHGSVTGFVELQSSVALGDDLTVDADLDVSFRRFDGDGVLGAGLQN